LIGNVQYRVDNWRASGKRIKGMKGLQRERGGRRKKGLQRERGGRRKKGLQRERGGRRKKG